MDTEQQREVVEKLMSGEPWKKKPTTRKKDPENDPDNVPETEPEDVAESDPDDNVENKCGRPVVDEAELFTAQNGEATPVLANEKLKAEFNTGKPGVTEMVRACESIGMFVDFTPRNKAMYHIKAVKTVYDIHGKLGYDGLVDVLSIIKDAWAGSPDSLTREILSGVALFYSTYSGQFQRKRLVDKLKKVDPVSIVREARSITSRGAVGTARVILRTYNANASQKTYIEGRI